MQLINLKLRHFKNYNEQDFEFHPKLNLILGDNGIGKTNLLDAIYYLAFGKSYYNIPDRKLIRFEAMEESDPFFRIEGHSNEGRRYEVTYGVNHSKLVRKNGVDYERLSDHIGEIPLVSVFPEDIYLIRHGSALRRKFVDGTIGQLNRNYLESLMRYNRILRRKNELLKNRYISARDKNILLDKYDAEMVPLIKEIETSRSAFVKDFNPLFTSYYEIIANRDSEDVQIKYIRSFQGSEIAELLVACRKSDWDKGRSTLGPHKDDFHLLLNQQRAKYFASQGQQKSILFAMKFAQYAYIQKEMKKNPILLLDDFFEKLDTRRILNVMTLLAAENKGQIFITDTGADRMAEIARQAKLEFEIIYIENKNKDVK